LEKTFSYVRTGIEQKSQFISLKLLKTGRSGDRNTCKTINEFMEMVSGARGNLGR